MDRIVRTTHFFLAAVASLLLAACGGGGNAFPIAPLSVGTAGSSQTEALPPTYAVGGTLGGLPANEKLVLLNNAGDPLTLTANGAFSFATRMAFNTGYAVTVGTQALWYDCAVVNGSGAATADVTGVSVSCTAAQAQVTTLAGSRTPGALDATGSAASFNQPDGVAVDAGDNVYVADYLNNEIRKITPAGVVTTLAGSTTPGSADGASTAASFSNPANVAVDADGNVYVADGNNNVIRKITPMGTVTTLAGSPVPGNADGTGSAASFDTPYGISVDAQGNLYVTDSRGNAVRMITSTGVVTTLAGSAKFGSADGTGNAASFAEVLGTAVDAGGNIYVADCTNHNIRKITQAGVVTTLAGNTTRGAADGTGRAASFGCPSGVAVDAAGNVYVADYDNNNIRKITPDGVVTTFAGSTTRGAADGIGAAASFFEPIAVAVDAGGNVYVADSGNNEIRKIAPIRQ